MSGCSFTCPRSTPWFSWEEWRSVHQGLYSQHPSEVMWALDVVESWMIRGRCPHSVETTAHLASYLLKSASYSPMESRLLASTIIVRAVNGLVEPLQQRLHADSVMTLAAKLGIPPWIVELRHLATHDKLPSLANLRLAATTLLSWLNDSYWQPQDNKLQQMYDACIRFIHARSEEQLLLEGYPQPQRITAVVDSVTAVSSLFAPAVIHSCVSNEVNQEWMEFVLQCIRRLDQVWGSALSACTAQAFHRLFYLSNTGNLEYNESSAGAVEAEKIMAFLDFLEPNIRSNASVVQMLLALQHRAALPAAHSDLVEPQPSWVQNVVLFMASFLGQARERPIDGDRAVVEAASDEGDAVFEECYLPLWPLGSMPGHLSCSLHLTTQEEPSQIA